MRNRRLVHVFAAATLLAAGGSRVSGAMMGGAASTVAGLGACHDNQLVPLDTVQDSFVLNATASCLGQSASVTMQASALVPSIGLEASSNPAATFGSQAAALVSSRDRWAFTVPADTPTGTLFLLPVTFSLDGKISPGSITGFPSYLNYVFAIIDPQQGFSQFQQTGSITAPGVYALTFGGAISLKYWGPSLGMLADVEMTLSAPGLDSGSIDFLHTGSISLHLPNGVTVATSSGQQLTFADSSDVPEPATCMLFGSGLIALLARRARSRPSQSRSIHGNASDRV